MVGTEVFKAPDEIIKKFPQNSASLNSWENFRAIFPTRSCFCSRPLSSCSWHAQPKNPKRDFSRSHLSLCSISFKLPKKRTKPVAEQHCLPLWRLLLRKHFQLSPLSWYRNVETFTFTKLLTLHDVLLSVTTSSSAITWSKRRPVGMFAIDHPATLCSTFSAKRAVPCVRTFPA